MSKPLIIPKSKRVPGLCVYCSKCDHVITETCKLIADVPVEKCKFGGQHRYKGIVYVDGHSRKTKTFNRDYGEAVEAIAKMRNALKRESREEISSSPSPPKEGIKREVEKGARDYAMASCMAKYVSFLCGDATVPIFKRRRRSTGHIADCERTYLRFAKAMLKHKMKIQDIRVDHINDDIVSKFYSYLVDDLALGNAAFNRSITNMVSLFAHLIESEGYPINNPFQVIVRKPQKQNVVTITAEQFSELHDAVGKPELGIHTFSNGKQKNYARKFLPDALELFLFSGRRRTECVLFKWNQIHYENDVAQFLEVPDYKYNNAKQLPEKDWKYNIVPITSELMDLLSRMNEKEHRHSDRYILAPDEKMSRETMASFLSKAFAHYAEKIGLDLSLGSLRRTNISSLSAAIGVENARTISGHAGLDVMRKHYLSKQVLSKTANEHSVFGKRNKNAPVRSRDAQGRGNDDFSMER